MPDITTQQHLDADNYLLVHYAMLAGAKRALLTLADRDFISAKLRTKIIDEANELQHDIDALRASLDARMSALQHDYIGRMKHAAA